jgi:S-adenosylmethionine:tRNA ribosyltransferase-isomerase
MQTALFDYDLPPHLIAQQPVEPRDSSRLLVLHRANGQLEHRRFHEIGACLRAGDLLVANNSRVIPARLHARKRGPAGRGGAVEIFLLRRLDESGAEWECLVRGKNIIAGSVLEIEQAAVPKMQPASQPPQPPISATVITVHHSGTRSLRFSTPITPYLHELGEIPLPPYITQYSGDRERYQTVYSQPDGSVAAPTAGLHFTPQLLLRLRQQGVGFDTVTLHVGLDTFRPVTTETIEEHQIHTEWAELCAATAKRINETTLQGGRIIAVGTTTARTLEWAATGAQGVDPYDERACPWQRVAAFTGAVSIFIRPGYRFRAVDALLTNFHLPRSSLLMMVSAFIGQVHPHDLDAGRRILLAAYAAAMQEGYRFYSFGDAMLVL